MEARDKNLQWFAFFGGIGLRVISVMYEWCCCTLLWSTDGYVLLVGFGNRKGLVSRS